MDPQLAAALARIGAHIGSAKKFRKAAVLLRELLASGQLQRQAHGQLAFAALDASMRDPSLVSDVSHSGPPVVEQHDVRAVSDPDSLYCVSSTA